MEITETTVTELPNVTLRIVHSVRKLPPRKREPMKATQRMPDGDRVRMELDMPEAFPPRPRFEHVFSVTMQERKSAAELKLTLSRVQLATLIAALQRAAAADRGLALGMMDADFEEDESVG